MYTGFIVKAGEITGDEIIDKSIEGFKYSNIDVICIKNDGIVHEIETFDTVKQILNPEPEINTTDLDEISDEELLNRFVALKNMELEAATE